jgi:hypothetical protein
MVLLSCAYLNDLFKICDCWWKARVLLESELQARTHAIWRKEKLVTLLQVTKKQQLEQKVRSGRYTVKVGDFWEMHIQDTNG